MPLEDKRREDKRREDERCEDGSHEMKKAKKIIRERHHV
jgi:hypothetical protein